MFGAAEEELIELALREDFGPAGDLSGDITTRATIPDGVEGNATIVAKEELVVCGHEIAERVFAKLDGRIHYTPLVPDGEQAGRGSILARLTGPYGAILSGERVALNFLQRLSGIATQTRKLVDRVGALPVKLIDTRKTTPGLRRLEKYAVRTGGGANHRMGLYDQVLIKNNHIDFLSGDVKSAVQICRHNAPPGTRVQVEVRSEDELRMAIEAGPDAVLLDNMTPQAVRQCLEILKLEGVRERIRVEASGGISEATLLEYAATGVDTLSMGALTHSVRAADISLRFAAA